MELSYSSTVAKQQQQWQNARVLGWNLRACVRLCRAGHGLELRPRQLELFPKQRHACLHAWIALHCYSTRSTETYDHFVQ